MKNSKKLRKLGVPFLAGVMAFTSMGTVSAQSDYNDIIESYFSKSHENQSVIHFETLRNRFNVSDRDIAAERLDVLGFSQNFLYELPESSIEILANAQKVFVSDVFHMEYVDGDDAYLVEITKDEFIRQNELNIENLINEYARNMKIINDDETYIDIAPNWNWVDHNVGGGVLWTRLALFNPTNSQAHYLAMANFEWTTMPSHRGTDFLGLTRGVGYSVVPNTFSAFTEHRRSNFRFQAVGANVLTTYTGTTIIPAGSFSNQLSLDQGLAIRFDVPRDNIPHSILQGSTLVGHVSNGLRGAVSYEGRLAQQSPWQQNLNHFITYLHQRTGITWGSPQLSVSFPGGVSASISAEPSNSYTTIRDVILAEWTWR
jgi:hypothetical protein